MTDLEQRLRRDLQRISQRAGAGSIRPLRIPPPRRRARAVRWLAPAAAVAAVIGVVAGVSLAGRSAGQGPGPAPGGMPSYYVTLTGASGGQQPALTATVRDSVTGAALTTVDVPVQHSTPHLPARPSPAASGGPSPVAGGGTPMPSGISAAADGRTFAITDDLGFFLLRVAADGRSAQLSRLPINVPYILSDTAALSPDGSQLAIDVESCPSGGCREGIDVVSLATGASKTWTGPSMAGSPLGPAWVGHGRELMFLWQVGDSPTPQGYRRLDIAGPGGGLLASSRPMVSPPLQDGWYFPGAVLTPDGRALITTDYRNIPGPDGGGTAVLRVVELSARTGRLLRVLHVATVPYTRKNPALFADADCNVLSLGPAGLHALVQCTGFGRLDGARFTPLPGMAQAMNPGTGIGETAAW
jgi:hypothetical protein